MLSPFTPKVFSETLHTVCHTLFYNFSCENLVLDQIITPIIMFFDNLITCLPDIVMRKYVLVSLLG